MSEQKEGVDTRANPPPQAADSTRETVRYHGEPVSEGTGVGKVYHGDPPAARATATGGAAATGGAKVTDGATAASGASRTATADDVREAFAAVARERTALAGQLRERGRDRDAGIVEIGALIAADPALAGPALDAVRGGADAVAAVLDAAEAQAALLAALPDPDLAQRADDVRQVGSAVAGRLRGIGVAPPPAGPFILIRREVDPADLIRLAEAGLAGAVSVSGGASSHAAIIARGLGVPMLAGADPGVLESAPGHPAILDAAAALLAVDPPAPELAAAEASSSRPAPATAVTGGTEPGHATAAGTAGDTSAGHLRTADGEQVTLLCNVASAPETRLGLSNGAAGVGLLRTEIPFTGASGWPPEASHLEQLEPVLGLLAGRPAVVRLLDFSGDKIPPFLREAREPDERAGGPGSVGPLAHLAPSDGADGAGGPAPPRSAAGAGARTGDAPGDGPAGLKALLRAPGALAAQVRAILRAGSDTRLAILVPMVTSVEEITTARSVIKKEAAGIGAAVPELGIMVEVAATAAAAEMFAPAADFFSIGTNDLTSEVLGVGRAGPGSGPALAADPRVLGLIAHVVRAASDAGVRVCVCGDAAADPTVLPLLLGLGVRTLSVGAARVPQVAAWIAETDTAAAASRAKEILDRGTVGWRRDAPEA
ncbi:MAG: hypothetical protein JOY82_05265 [Streptosporangiaceae bacterium]|nr:hypothetical protein [Streptosporangiaceae bacterium]